MKAWEEFLQSQEKELGAELIKKWLRPFKVVKFDACNLYLEASDSFKLIWFEEHMRHKVRKFLVNNNNKSIAVHLSVAASSEGVEKRGKKKTYSGHLPIFRLEFDELDGVSTFENFIASPGNVLAHKLLLEGATQKGPLSFNPIYLFGRKGVGKTHLMIAMTRLLCERGLKAIYVHADTFTEHVVNAIRTGQMQQFRKTYRHADALLVDDVEVFSRKGATQEEFFHTFNTLHVEGKQIVLSSSTSPNELKFIEPRLVSRFEWGIVVPLQMLGKEEMGQLLLQRSQNMQFPLTLEIRAFLIEVFGKSTTTLLRAFEALVLRTHLSKELYSSLTQESVKSLLADLIEEVEKVILTPAKIIRTVAEYYGIRMDDILSKSQTRESTLPRQIAMHLCRQELQLPYMKIGDIFSRDHSTVMSSIRHIQQWLEEKNQEIIGSLTTILKRLET